MPISLASSGAADGSTLRVSSTEGFFALASDVGAPAMESQPVNAQDIAARVWFSGGMTGSGGRMGGWSGPPTRERTYLSEAQSFLERLASAKPGRRARIAREAPLDAIRSAALHHADPFVRRRCISFLDHYFNDASSDVFARALGDPVDLVRNMALHSIACETCRFEELCAADVVPYLAAVLAGDPNVDLRHKAIPLLLRLADRDVRAREAVERASEGDPDELIRSVAARAIAGEHVRRKTYERGARRRGVAPTQRMSLPRTAGCGLSADRPGFERGRPTVRRRG